MNMMVPHRASGLPWWQDGKQVALVRRMYARDCNADEFSVFVALCEQLRLSPMRKQVYAFVFNKDKPDLRQLSLVVGIDGARSIAARTGNYRPDDRAPEWEFDEKAVNALTNPHGVVSCTVGVYHRPTKDDPFVRIVGKVFWDEFAPIVRAADADAYEWVGTGEVYPEGHKNAGREKQRRQLRPGADAAVSERLDPKKQQWIKGGRHKVSLCAEMQALRRAYPEDIAAVYVEEETDKHASTIDAEYTELTPSELADQADASARVERIGGPAILAVFDDTGTLERVGYGVFADRVLAHTEKMTSEGVATWVDRNRAALQEFWTHNKTDALELKKTLEKRSLVSA